jgi:hypothetical protein
MGVAMRSIKFNGGKPLRGAGDVFRLVAGPVAAAIDGATARAGFPTKLKNCAGCNRRRVWLNDKIPFA